MLSQPRCQAVNTVFEARLAKRTSNKKRTKKWKCKLSEMLVGEYCITPLTSAKMLKSESYLMNNCYRDYIPQCAELKYCFFSITSRSGERTATLGLIYDEGSWCFDQCFGSSNRDVLEETLEYTDDDGMLQIESSATELYYVAHEVVRLMNAIIDN